MKQTIESRSGVTSMTLRSLRRMATMRRRQAMALVVSGGLFVWFVMENWKILAVIFAVAAVALLLLNLVFRDSS